MALRALHCFQSKEVMWQFLEKVDGLLEAFTVWFSIDGGTDMEELRGTDRVVVRDTFESRVVFEDYRAEIDAMRDVRYRCAEITLEGISGWLRST